jgi:hypothetical protein
MSVVDWKQIGTLDLGSLRTDPAAYVRALFLRKDWSTLLALSSDVGYSAELKKVLKIPFVVKQIFTSLTADDIIQLLAPRMTSTASDTSQF